MHSMGDEYADIILSHNRWSFWNTGLKSNQKRIRSSRISVLIASIHAWLFHDSIHIQIIFRYYHLQNSTINDEKFNLLNTLLHIPCTIFRTNVRIFHKLHDILCNTFKTHLGLFHIFFTRVLKLLKSSYKANQICWKKYHEKMSLLVPLP